MTELEKEIYKFTITIENFSTILSNRISTQKNNKDNYETNNINQLDPTDIYRTLPTSTAYAFSQVHVEQSPRQIISWVITFEIF